MKVCAAMTHKESEDLTGKSAAATGNKYLAELMFLNRSHVLSGKVIRE